MTTNEAALKLAREILASLEGDPTWKKIRLKEAPDTIRMKIALAAILEVTERAAKLAEQGQYNRVHLATPLSITEALRDMEHLS